MVAKFTGTSRLGKVCFIGVVGCGLTRHLSGRAKTARCRRRVLERRANLEDEAWRRLSERSLIIDFDFISARRETILIFGERRRKDG